MEKTIEMKVPLQEWYNEWRKEHEGTTLLYVNSDNPSLHQVRFICDTLKWQFFNGPSLAGPGDDRDIFVIGEHHSKSVRLPVYLLARADIGLQFILRENFYDWNLSVKSDKEIDLHGFSDDNRLCFFQGFPSEYQFGHYNKDKRQFSLNPVNDYELYVATWLIMKNFGLQ